MIALPLKVPTPPAWAEVVLSHFDAFLLDHAACERKASALAMSFVTKYPDRVQLIEPMIALAREELEHFHQVYKVIARRGMQLLAQDTKDQYVNLILAQLRHGREERLLDRLVASAVIEARGCERFSLLSDALDEGEMKKFYKDLARSEAGHYQVFLRLARLLFSEQDVSKTLNRLLEIESEAMMQVPPSGALH